MTDLKSDTPGYIIERTAKRLKRAFQQTLHGIDAGITVDQWVLLDLTVKQPGLSQQAIAELVAKDRPTVTRIIDLLEKKHLVERRADDEDRRRFGIYPTSAGKKKVSELLPLVKEFRRAHFEGLDDGDIRHLLRIMDKINQNIHIYKNGQHALL